MSQLIKTVCFGAVAFGLSHALSAQSDTATVRLNEVTITASKIEQKQSQTGKVVTVLPDSVLLRYANQSVGELLTRQAGLMVVGSQGPLGSNQEIYLRGAGAGNTLVLLDGIPVYDPSFIDPTFDLNLISVGECERIEILRGSQSTLYGSGAVAGVINILTRRNRPESGQSKLLTGSASINYGSYGTFRGTASASGASSRLYYNVQYTRQSSAGFSAATDRANAGFDNDGFRQNALLANLGFYLRPNLILKFRSLLSGNKTDIDAGAFADEKDYTFTSSAQLLATGLEYRFGRAKLTANYGWNNSRRVYLDDSTSVEKNAFSNFQESVYGGIAQFADVFVNVKATAWLDLLAGVDYWTNNTNQSYRSVSSFGLYEAPALGRDTAQTNLLSGYLSGIVRMPGGFSVELGGRVNRHSLYGTNATYSINPSYLLLNGRVKAFANVSSGFRAPSLYQLFSPYGNRGLRPEISQSAEVGVQLLAKNNRTNLRLLYFDRQIQDVIVFQSLSKAPFGIYQNFDRQHDQGWELEGQVQSGGWSVWGNATWVTGAVTTKAAGRDTTYNNLIRRPKLLINAGLGYQLTKALFVSSTVRAVGDRQDRFYNEKTFKSEATTLAAYQTVDFYAEYKIGTAVRFYGDLRNAFDAQYADSYGFNTRGRNGQVGVRLTF